MINEAEKIEMIRELFDLPTMLLEAQIDIAEQSLKELQSAPNSDYEADNILRDALIEAAEITLVIAYALTDPDKNELQRKELAKAKCALMGINAFGVLDDPQYNPEAKLNEMGFHFN